MILPILLHLAVAHRSAIQGIKELPIVQVTGKFGGYTSPTVLYRMLGEAKPNFRDPVSLSNSGVVFFDSPGVYAYFDTSYRPVQILLAKKDLIELILAKGVYAVTSYGEMPQHLKLEFHDRVIEQIQGALIPESTETAVSIQMTSSLTVNDTNIDFAQKPDVKPTSDELNAIENIKAHVVLNPHEKKVPKLYEDRPTTQIFSGLPSPTLQDFKREHDILRRFAVWYLKKSEDLDKVLFLAMEQKQAWHEMIEVMRSKHLSEMERAAPNAYSSIMSKFLESYEKFGFSDADSMRSAMASAPIQTSSGFLLTYYDSDGRQLQIKFP